VGYDLLESNSSITAIIKNGSQVKELTKGDDAVIFIESTPFYGESGGQVGDSGQLIFDDGIFEVLDTQKQVSGAFEHHGRVISGSIRMTDSANAKVDASKRKKNSQKPLCNSFASCGLKESSR